MKKLIIIFLFCLINSFESLSQDFQWVRQIKGITHDYNDFTNGLAVDNNENSYVIGSTDSLIFDLDPTSTGTDIVDNTIIGNSFKGTYLIKTDVNGNYIWGLTFSLYKGNIKGYDVGYDVKIGTDGNIYALLTLDELNITLNVIDSYIKIVKISPQGEILSTISIKQNYDNTGNNNIYVNSFDLDNQNNIYLCGYFTGNVSINDISSLNLNNDNSIGNYLLKINNTGNFDWVKQFNITDNSNCKLIVRPDQNINLMMNNYGNYILYNIDSIDNSIIWQKDFLNQKQKGIHVSSNEIIILGEKNDIADVVDVDPSANVVNVTDYSCFAIFLTINGMFNDVKIFNIPLDGYLNFNAVTKDSENNYTLVGNFENTVDIDASSSTYNLTTSSSYGEGFVLKLDENRLFLNAFKIGKENPTIDIYHNCYQFYQKGLHIVNGNLYIFGEFMWTCDFNPSLTEVLSLETINSSTINKDGFLLKLGQCNSLMPNGNNSQSFCSSQNPTIANLSPNSSSIKWFDSLTSTVQLSNLTSLVNGQTYFAAYQNASCPESARLPVTVTINQSPLPPITNNQVFCESDNATISTLIADGLDIKWYASLTDTSELPSNFLLNTNSYYATQTINGCESDRTITSVIINSTPNPTLTSPQTFCIQQNATLNDITISGSNINWYDASTAGNLLSNSTILIDGTTYYASQTINGCESFRVPVTISIQDTIAPSGDSNQILCSTSNPTLNDLIVTGTSINWYANSSSTTILPNSTSLTDGVTYFATQTINGCESVIRFPVTVSIINSLNANNYSQSFCDDLNDGLENVLLSDYNSNLISSTANTTFTYYTSLNGAENQVSNNQLNTNYTLNLGLNTIYVRLDSTNGCHQVVKLELSLFQKPIISIDDIIPICKSTNIIVNAGSGFNSYLWSNGATTQSISILTSGTYSVTVTKNYGTITCSSTKSFDVIESDVATITSIETEDWTDVENVIIISTAINDNYQYSLDGINYQESNTFSGLISGFYTVFVKDECGIVNKDVVLLNYPKYFTPNNDGINDYWRIKFSQYEPNLTITIFDRYGKEIKSLNSNSLGWDGTYNGSMLISDDYWFVVKRADGREHRGHFTLKR